MKILKKRIRMADMTIKQVADRIKIPYSTLSSYLNGYNPMPNHVLQSIEEVLGENNN